MNRREFLKSVSLVAVVFGAGGVFAETPKKNDKEYLPDQTYGNVVMCTDCRNVTLMAMAVEVLVEDANKVLPRGVWYELRWAPYDYGRSAQIAWYTSPGGKKAAFYSNINSMIRTPQWAMGYKLIARLQSRG